MSSTERYDSQDLDVLEGLEPVQTRPGMYTDTRFPNHMVQEVVDNSIDEALAGHANLISIILGKDSFVSVSDNGRGIPTSIHPKEKMSGVEVILEKLHAGGKFKNQNYQFSGGLHGVGISVVNALSDVLEVTVKREGKTHAITYHNGKKQSKLQIVKGGTVKKSDTGTTVRFKPNPKYFDSPSIQTAALLRLLSAKAILSPGVRITVDVEDKDKQYDFYYEKGLPEFIDQQLQPEFPILGNIAFCGKSKKNEPIMEFEWGCFFSEEGYNLQDAYVNLIPTVRGGTHVNAFRQGLFEGMKEYVSLHNLNPKSVAFNGNDLWGLTQYIISLKMQDPSFAGQTKESLSSRECASFVIAAVKDNFSLYLNQHTEQANELWEAVLYAAALRTRQKRKVKRKEIGKINPLPGKLTDCKTRHRDDAELFLVEGDSAGGSAKQARDRDNQAVLPLRGKILNSWELDPERIMDSQEISDIATAIGVDPGSDDLSSLRYGKICILADADSDGLHIATLFIGLMLAHFPILIEKGHIFVAMPPLYRIDIGKKVFYALDDSEKEQTLNRIKKEKLRGEINVQRFKGLGEMNPSQLRETTLDPVTRRLVQLTNSDPAQTHKMFDMLLKKKNAHLRQQWLSENGDEFELEV
jgi:topoisomerase-4 subunit B